ncbi:hypothetical protein BB560_000621 [Smittium megazygosporum]|uniref:Sterol 24-C-methyltransferase n=1 Tax=Smittium megazygosporum TaxID=133381 RepID=A0A2T9ZJU7_9FUNG|nr:hypothetical protein BB560_000621 [Smittium megazygosporum]
MPKAIEGDLVEPTTENTNLLHGSTSKLDPGPLSLLSSLTKKDKTLQKNTYKTYEVFWDSPEADSETTELQRKQKSTDMTNTFYNLVTDFYEYGWGESFHFARRCKGETLAQSLTRHEEYLFASANIKKGMKVLDVGCGVGGPARTCVRFTGAYVVGLNNNDYQIEKARRYAKQKGQENYSQFVKGDFLHMPFEDNSFDAVYAIEATCHSPDLISVYKEMFRVLKPGGTFAIYEWCTTEKYDEKNKEMIEIIKEIEYGNSLPKLYPASYSVDCVKKCGFEIQVSEDLAPTSVSGDSDWYQDLFQKRVCFSSIGGFVRSKFGSSVMSFFLKFFSFLRLVPSSATNVDKFLKVGGIGCAKGGKADIFTPMFIIVAKKPLA